MGSVLYELLSDEQLQKVITRFYDSVYSDELLKPLFEDVNRPAQELRLFRFIKMTAIPGADRLDGAFLRTAHARLNLNEELFERRRTLLEAAIRACGHGDEVSSAWRNYDDRWRAWVLGEPTQNAS